MADVFVLITPVVRWVTFLLKGIRTRREKTIQDGQRCFFFCGRNVNIHQTPRLDGLRTLLSLLAHKHSVVFDWKQATAARVWRWSCGLTLKMCRSGGRGFSDFILVQHYSPLFIKVHNVKKKQEKTKLCPLVKVFSRLFLILSVDFTFYKLILCQILCQFWANGTFCSGGLMILKG